MPLVFILGDSTDCDREVCSIVSGEEEDLKFLEYNINMLLGYII